MTFFLYSVGIMQLLIEDQIEEVPSSFGVEALSVYPRTDLQFDESTGRREQSRYWLEDTTAAAMASSSNSPCAACKFLRRKCTQECVFSPYFPPDQPQKFCNVHKVFGASNVAKLLNDLNPSQREVAVISLAYEAEEWLRNPVYGCVGYISVLQQSMKQIQQELHYAKKELASYIGPTAMLQLSHPRNFLQQMHASESSVGQPFEMPTVGPSIPTPAGVSSKGVVLLHEQQQQLASAFAAREQEMLLRNYEQQQHHQVNLKQEK